MIEVASAFSALLKQGDCTHTQALLNESCWSVPIEPCHGAATVLRLTPFIIRYMLISQDDFVLRGLMLLTSGKPPTLW